MPDGLAFQLLSNGNMGVRHNQVSVVRRRFDLRVAIRRLRKSVAPLPKAAMFQLAEEGYRSVFEQLVACIISIRTRDETTVPVARRLFATARTPVEVVALNPAQID